MIKVKEPTQQEKDELVRLLNEFENAFNRGFGNNNKSNCYRSIGSTYEMSNLIKNHYLQIDKDCIRIFSSNGIKLRKIKCKYKQEVFINSNNTIWLLICNEGKFFFFKAEKLLMGL